MMLMSKGGESCSVKIFCVCGWFSCTALNLVHTPKVSRDLRGDGDLGPCLLLDFLQVAPLLSNQTTNVVVAGKDFQRDVFHSINTNARRHTHTICCFTSSTNSLYMLNLLSWCDVLGCACCYAQMQKTCQGCRYNCVHIFDKLRLVTPACLSLCYINR